MAEFKQHEDFISSLLAIPDKKQIIATRFALGSTCAFQSSSLNHELCLSLLTISCDCSGDGSLSVNNYRSKKIVQSQNIEDELLSVVTIMNGGTCVCGTQDGDLLLFKVDHC